MVEIDCICCGAELSGRDVHAQPAMSCMCERCAREMKQVQRALEIAGRESHPAMIH
jgi:hypothetical protein